MLSVAPQAARFGLLPRLGRAAEQQFFPQVEVYTPPGLVGPCGDLGRPALVLSKAAWP